MITRDTFFIGARWVRPAGSGSINVVSPITEEPIGRVPDSTPADIDEAVTAARRAFDIGPWPRMSLSERGEFLLRMAELLEPRIAETINLQINEMGGTRKFIQAVTGSPKARVRHAIDVARKLPLREVRDGYLGKVVVLREPIGVVAGIIPWNAPFASVMSKMLPALLTGCPIIIKPSPETPLSAYVIADALDQVGLPPGTISIIHGGREVGEYLVSHPGIDKVSFTGSTAAGRRVGSICGDQIKPVTLELGGKSAAIVLDDVDLGRALPALIGSSMPNNGQACVATTRILAPQSRYQELVDRLTASIGSMKVGNPLEDDTDFGPLVASRQRDRVEGYIKAGIDAGARIALGGGRPPIKKGWYVEPTVFTHVDNSMRIAQEEIFGPVVVVMPYSTVDEAIRIANDSEYGLGGGVFTTNVERGLSVAAQLRTGSCVINDGLLAGGGGPFGGYKKSGIGRESGPEGIANYYQLKSVSLPPGLNFNHPGRTANT
jgi:aldehyde dehydrogenase (NAD+)